LKDGSLSIPIGNFLIQEWLFCVIAYPRNSSLRFATIKQSTPESKNVSSHIEECLINSWAVKKTQDECCFKPEEANLLPSTQKSLRITYARRDCFIENRCKKNIIKIMRQFS
jgi:hypothetical protein